MNDRKKIIPCIIIGIFCINISITVFPINNEDFFDSKEIVAELLKGIGFSGNSKETFHAVPALLGTAVSNYQFGNTSHPEIRAGIQSEYSVPGWADTRWKFRKNITVDNTKVISDLTNFPLLIDLYDEDLSTTAQSSGNDIIFADNSGLILDHEVEAFNRVFNSTHAHLVAWVSVNLSGTVNTSISMYYGNPTATNQEKPSEVWDSNFLIVQHLQETSGTMEDSTSNGHDGTASGGVTLDASGKIDGADDFDGVNDVINVSVMHPQSYNDFTISAWYKSTDTSVSDDQYIWNHLVSYTSTGIVLSVTDDPGETDHLRLSIYDNDNNFSPYYGTSDIVNQQFHYVSGIRENGRIKLFVDGVMEINASDLDVGEIINVNTSDGPFIGDLPGDTEQVKGILDEFRVSNAARSTGWIETEYNNQYDPTSFYSVSSKETYDTGNWNLNSFRYRKNITIDATKVFQDLTDFPILIDLFDTNLRDEQKVQADGDDIVFTDTSDTKLDHEIELFDQTFNSTHAHLVAWIKVPFVSNTLDTSILMYYGNPAVPSQQNPESVWNSNYLAVHHMEESPTSTLYDSTSNNEDLSPQGSMTSGDLVNAQIGQGIDFDNVNDGMVSSSTISVNDFTFSAWINPDTVIDDWDCVVNVGHLEAIYGWIGLENGVLIIDSESSGYAFGSALSPDNWYHIAITYDGSTVRGFVDGSFEDSYSQSWSPITYRFQVGAFALDSSYNDLDDHFDGIIDEVRIINTPRSAGWIATEHENQLNPNTFYLVSNEETNPNWWVDGSFNKRRDIVIDHTKVDGDLTNFSVLIELTERSLRTGNIQPDADDLLFVDSEGNKLDHEIEFFSQNDTFGELIAWVRIPKLSSIYDTIISMYYGNNALESQANPETVWDTSYRGVWHLNNDPTGTVYDSTSNNYDGSSGGSMTPTDLISGKIGGAIDFDGSNDYITFSDPLDTSTMTISAWVYLNAASASWITIAMRTNPDSWFDWQFYARASDAETSNHAVFRASDGSTGGVGAGSSEVESDIVLSAGNWYYLVGESNSSHNLFYTDGVLTETELESDPIPDSNRNLWIAGNEEWGEYLQGIIDEVRVSSIARSTNWILAEYFNQFEPQNFYFLGPEVSLTPNIVIEETVTKEEQYVSQIVTPQIAGVDNQLYLLSVSTKGYKDTTSVTGLGLNWIELEDQPGGRSQTGISVWYAIGTNVSTGNVTVTLESSPTSIAIQVHRLSGVDVSYPIGDTESANTNGKNGLGSGGIDDPYPTLDIVTTTPNVTVFGAIGRRLYPITTPGADYILLTENQIGSGGDIAGISTEYKIAQTTGTVLVNATLSSDCDWAIAGIEIRPAIIDIFPPVVTEFGVDDSGTGTGIFWGNITDSASQVQSASIKINETVYSMTNNGTHWVYQCSVNYTDYFVYQIFNATDSWKNSLEYPSIEKSYTFTKDTVLPDVLQWSYIQSNNTFQANVTDSWGEVDFVIVNVTTYNLQALMGQYTTYGSTIFAYMNDTLEMANGIMDFQIIVNDTAGNEFASSTHQGDVFSNHPPIAENLTLSPAIPWSNCSQTLTYDYYDEDGHGQAGTEIRWYKKNDSVFLLEPSYNDTDLIPASALVVNDQWYVNVTPKDGGVFGETNMSAIITILNTPPSVSDVVIFYSGADPYTTSTLSIDYTYDDHEGDIEDINNREVEWYQNSVHNSMLDNSTSVPPGNTTKGETWYYRIRVYDGTGYSSWVSSDTVLIQNSIPQAVNLTLPSNPTTMDDLVAGWDMADADGDTEDLNEVIIYWYKDGENQSAWTNLTTIGAGNTSKGESWRFEIRVYDGENYSALTPFNPPVVILNSAPTVNNVEVIPATPVTTDGLNATWDEVDDDNDSLTYIIRWYIVGVGLQSAYNDLETVSVSATSKGQTWYYNLTAFDGDDYSLEVSSSQIVILNSPPEVTNLALTATPKTATNLVASWDAADNDTGDSLTFNVTWYLDGGVNCSWLTSANSVTLTAGNTTKGDNWSFTVQAYDGEVYSSVISLGYNQTIINTIPVIQNLTITSNPTTTESLLAAFDYSDADLADNTSLIFNITWYRNGQEQIDFANTTSIDSGNTNKTQFWWFTVHAYDGENYSLKLESVHVQILNTAPDINNLVITPPSPTTATDLVASWNETDADNDSLTYTIRWYIVGVGLQSAYNDLKNISASATSKGQTWYYNLTTFDGDASSPEKSSSQVVIQNSPPEVDSLEVTTNPTTTNDLVASWTAIDNDTGDSLTFNVTWFLDGAFNNSWFTSASSVILTAGNTTKNQTWNVTIQAYDGEAYSSILSLATNITILNSKPTVANPSFNDTSPDAGDDFHITYTFVDVDVGDVEDQGEVIVYWYVNWNYNASFQNQTTIYAVNTTATEVWYYIVRVFDGETYSDNATSEQGVYIGGGSTNTRPIAIDLTLTPSSPNTKNDLMANYSFSDPDVGAEEVAYETRWYKNNILQSIYNNLFTIPASATSKGQQWNFTVRVFDGIQWSELNNSIVITIVNTNPEVSDAGITSSPKTTNDLVASWDATDNDSDSLTFILTWYLNGIENSTFVNKTIIEAGNTTKGEEWYFTVQAYDGEGLSNILSLGANITILNTAPLASNLNITASPYTFDDLVADWDYFDIDGDPRDDASAQINWFKNGLNQTALVNQKTVGSTNTSKNQVWWFTVRVFDGENYSVSYESAHIQILNSIPVVENLEISISNPKTTDKLFAHWDPYDNDSDILSYTIKWYKNTIYQPDWDNEITIPASATSKGEFWYYTLKMFDGSDYSSEETLTPSIIILNTVPIVEDLALTMEPQTTDDLVASWTSSDNDSDSLTFIVTWYVNGIENTTLANKTMIEAGNTTKGEKWYFAIQAYDGEGLSSVISLAVNITILNTAPMASNLAITVNPTTLDDLVADWDYFDIDNDPRDDASARINWFKNGENQTILANQKTVGATNTSKNQVWWFTVQVFDGEDYSLLIYESAHIFIQNSVPYSTSALPLPTNPTKANGLVLTLSAIIDVLYDPDPSDDIEVVRIRWYKEGTLQSTLNDSLNVPGTRLTKGEVWNYSIVPFDGVAYGAVCVSAEIVILNSRPTIINTYFTEPFFTTISDLVISFQAEDADGDNITISGVRWYRWEFPSWVYNDTYDDYVSLPATATTKGESWKFQLEVFDGTDQSVWREVAKEADISNSEPRIDPFSITLTGGTTTSDPLQVSYAWYDDDPGDSNTLTLITWENSGDYLEDSYSTTLSADETTAGEKWWVTITPYDGEDIGDYVNSKRYGISIIIGNTPPSLASENIEINGEFNGTEYQGMSFGTVFNLNLQYTASDLDGNQGVPAYGLSIVDGFASGSEYRWYRNRSGIVTLISVLNDETTVPFYYTQKRDNWWVQVRPRDFYGDFGIPQNSSQITIGNTAPQITELHWVRLTYYTTNNLVFGYTFFDYDTEDIQQGIFIRWYRNGTHLPGFDNNTAIASQFTKKGEVWYVNISIFDGESYSSWCSLLSITIQNSPPTVTSILLTPVSPNTTQPLLATWTFDDADNDSENQVAALIQWYRNGISVDSLTNNSNVPPALTNREESWYFTVQVTDGYNYSIIIYQSDAITIINSAPIVLDLQINDGSTEINTTADLILTWNFNDPDILDIEDRSSALILWYLNGIEQSAFRNDTYIPAESVVKGQEWMVSIKVCDNGGLWSEFLNSSLVVIKNSVPTITIDMTAHPEFVIEDETLQINTSFYSYTDEDGDEDQPVISWYCNDELIYQNIWVILANDTLPGDVWYYTIQPFDGTDYGVEHTSPEIHVESRPVIHSFIATALPDTEGHYELEINVTDSHNEIKQVEFLLSLNNTIELPLFIITSPKSLGSTLWLLDYTLATYSYLDTPTLVTVTVVTKVTYSTIDEIHLIQTFTFALEDKAPPRVLNAYFEMNDDLNPTNLTFSAEVQDFGSGVADVILFYYFRPSGDSNQSGGNGAALLQDELDWLDVPMMIQVTNESGQFILYMVTVDFVHENSDLDIIYRISTEDVAGNANPAAFDIRDYPQRIIDQGFTYQPPGLPEWVLLVAGLAVFVIFVGSIVYVKFIRKPELVGLDKELVMAKISDITEAELKASLDDHTIGVVVSFFDQRHGPIPIIIVPGILKDNFNKLVDLSDRSFSGTGFADDISVEIPSSYDFVLSHGIRTSVMSFGFALERPESRGGQENLTCNIIIHQDLFPLIQSFQNEIKRKVHSIHVKMDTSPSEKDEIRTQIFELRKFVSSIVLSYANIYGTTELIEEEN